MVGTRKQPILAACVMVNVPHRSQQNFQLFHEIRHRRAAAAVFVDDQGNWEAFNTVKAERVFLARVSGRRRFGVGDWAGGFYSQGMMYIPP